MQDPFTDQDNAIKYGNGEGITVDLNKEEDGFYFIIKNKGEVPAERSSPTYLTVSGADRMLGI